MKNRLEIDSVYKIFGYKKILSDIHLSCEIGYIIGVFGRNGSGKSTLLKILFGTMDADYKFVRLNNKVVTKPFKVNDGLTYLPQHDYIPRNFSVQKSITLMINANKVVEFCNDEIIDKIKNNRIIELSAGELKYLQVKLLLFSDAKFCLLDEPYSGVSPVICQLINKQIIEQSSTKGIIITDHNYASLLEIATRIYLLKNGVGKFLQNKKDLITFGYLNEGMLDE